jgi:hypothetical protein
MDPVIPNTDYDILTFLKNEYGNETDCALEHVPHLYGTRTFDSWLKTNGLLTWLLYATNEPENATDGVLPGRYQF